MHLKGRIITSYSRVIEGNLKILESHEGIKLLVKYKGFLVLQWMGVRDCVCASLHNKIQMLIRYLSVV